MAEMFLLVQDAEADAHAGSGDGVEMMAGVLKSRRASLLYLSAASLQVAVMARHSSIPRATCLLLIDF